MSSADPEKPASASDTPSMIPAHMPAFDEKYNDAQRDAVARAALDRGIRPAQRIVDLAAAGELDGLDAFTMPVSTVRSIARHYRRRRRGELPSKLTEMPAPDANEIIRRRLLALTDRMLEAEEKRQPSKVDHERVRGIARAQLEVKRLGPAGDRAPSHGTRDEEGKRGPRTTGGLAGALLKDHRNAQGETEADAAAQHSEDRGEHADNDALPPTQTDTERDALPGAQPSEQDALLLG